MIFLLLVNHSSAENSSNIHKDVNENEGDSECFKCHTSHQEPAPDINNNYVSYRSSEIKYKAYPYSSIVYGNITLITSVGQNWYQQGIYGLGTKTWGWTFFDEIENSSEMMYPPEKAAQRNKIFALLLDSGNNSSPIDGAQVTANITYWTYDGSNYRNNTYLINLSEDPDHRGLYSEQFSFTGNATSASGCSYCHALHGQDVPQPGNFPGNYSGTVTARIGDKESTRDLQFQVTSWGCEDCHGSPNPHKKGLLKAGEACYLCHGLNDMGHDEAGNPHQIIAHRSIECTQCHTIKSISSQTFDGVTLIQGGINNSRSVPQYNYTAIQLNGGTHLNLTCIECHGDLTLPAQPGNYKIDKYTINNTVNKYIPDFLSFQEFQDYYIINVTSGGPLNISLDWEGSSNIGFFVFPPGYIFDLDRAPYYDGSTFTNKPEIYSNMAPSSGDWMAVVYGYNFIYGLETGEFQGPMNYTLNSTYPLIQKKLPFIPECSTCHNSNAAGKAFTTDVIPDWNPGFAHVDTNNDGELDIQCRMCHNSMHEITVKSCRDCHVTAPTDHPIQEPAYSQKTVAECLECHGDPHIVTSSGGTDCIACHSPADVNISKFARHADINRSDGDDNVTNNDCWTCHYEKDMNRNHVYLCRSCHSNSSGIIPIANTSLIKSDLMHGMASCKVCHAPNSYHLKGTAGPLGFVENILKKVGKLRMV